MRLPTASEHRVLLLQRAAVALFGPHGSVAYLHTFNPHLGTTPAAAAWIGGSVGRLAGELLRALAAVERRGRDRESVPGALRRDEAGRRGDASALQSRPGRRMH